MEFRDLNAQYQALKGGINAGIARVLEHGRYIGGPEVAELEARLAAYVGARHCITCANGTDALQLALMAWGVGPGDAVFVPDFTFFASGEAPALLGAMPVFVDVDERTFNLDPAKLEEAVRFVEDGTACSFGDVSTTSFFPAKPLGCYGDGGAVFTDNDEWAELVRSYAVHGKGSMKYDNVRVGVNSRLDTVQAAVLLAKLDAFEGELDAVGGAAALYFGALAGSGLALPEAPEGFRSSWAQYTVRLPEGLDRDALQAALKERGVPTMVYYPKPMHGQGAFEGACLCPDGCPVTERLCETVLSLPMGPYMISEDVSVVADSLVTVFG